MANSSRLPSSSTAGFFQSLPVVEPQYTLPELVKSDSQDVQEASDDPVLARILMQYLPRKAQSEVGAAIHHLSRRVLHPSTLGHAVDAETNTPVLRPLTTFGMENRVDPLWTSEGWKALKTIGIEEDIVGRAYAQGKSHNRRVEQFGLAHVWTHTSSMTMCPASMTDGAVKLLSRHLGQPDGDQPGRNAVFAESLRRLVSKNPREAWTSGQWMTERTGGSDVSGTETLARRLTGEEIACDEKLGRTQDGIGLPLGPWRIDGFKWFSSATDSDMTVLLAQTGKGLSAFYIPMRRNEGKQVLTSLEKAVDVATELNGIRIQRLKHKMGTRALPTAELELKGARGWLIGEEGKGIKEIATLLNITRVHAATSSVSYWSRGMSICRAYSKVRKTRGRPLTDNSQHVFWMAEETVKYWAAAHFAFFGVALLGSNEQGWKETTEDTTARILMPREDHAREALLRLLTPVMKAQVTVGAVSGLRASMECLGGVGYCENQEDGGVLNIAKMFRDASVNAIWEGTVSVMAEDVGRVIKGSRKQGVNVVEDVFAAWARGVIRHCRGRFAGECAVVEERLEELIALVREIGPEELEYRGRDILVHLEAISCAVLLLFNAHTDGDKLASHIATRYAWSKTILHSQYRREDSNWEREVSTDRKIFLGRSEQPREGLQGKL